MIFVKCASIITHQGIVVPRLGYHHHHGVRQGIAASHQELEGIVVGRRIRVAVADQRPQFIQIVAQYSGGHGLPTRCHPVDVAAHSINFAVVAQEAKRLRQFPGWEGIG